MSSLLAVRPLAFALSIAHVVASHLALARVLALALALAFARALAPASVRALDSSFEISLPTVQLGLGRPGRRFARPIGCRRIRDAVVACNVLFTSCTATM